MTEKEYLRSIISGINGQNRVRLSKFIDNLSLIINDTNLWQQDELSLNLYYKDVRHIKTTRYKGSNHFDYTEENKVIAKAQNGDSGARQEVINNNLRYVIGIAKKYQNRGLPLNDLIGEGNLGLIKAAEKYDTSSIFSFRTYARYYIVNSISDALNKYGTIVHYPSKVSEINKKIHRYVDRARLENGEIPTPKDISKYLNLEMEVVYSNYDAVYPDVRLDEISAYFNDLDFYDEFIDSIIDRPSSLINGFQVDEDMHEELLSIDIRSVLESLRPREKEILKMYFGIGCKKHLLDEIAYHFDLTKERIRQIKEVSIRRLVNKRPDKLRKYLL